VTPSVRTANRPSAVLACLLTLLLAACSTILVETDHDSSVDFSRFRTWAWDPATAHEPAAMDALVRPAVERELAAKGLGRVDTDTPDLHVEYSLAVEGRHVQTRSEQSYAYSRGTYGGWGRGATEREWKYEEGSLTLLLSDGATGRVVWRGTAREVVDPQRTDAERKAVVDEAVGKLLRDFPPR
jgi:hypothetical protein